VKRFEDGSAGKISGKAGKKYWFRNWGAGSLTISPELFNAIQP
jgi:hypothetical protein